MRDKHKKKKLGGYKESEGSWVENGQKSGSENHV